jgi:hypothetical protein
MFKEGQLVTAEEFNCYAVTDRGKPCEVVWCNHGRMRVRCLWENEEYIVDTAKFRPMSEDEILKPGQQVIIDTFRKVRGRSHTEVMTFVGYTTYGAKVRTNNGNYITVSMHSVKGVVKGGLYI